MSKDLSIFAGGALKSGLNAVIPKYMDETGQRIAPEYMPMGPLLERLAAGATPDIIVVAEESSADPRATSWADGSKAVEVGRVGIGVAVHEAAPMPDIATAEAFKRTLLAARSLVTVNPATGTSGRYLAQLFDKIGIAEQLRGKLRFVDGGYAAEPVARGEVEIALQQITEIRPVKGVKLVGPLPPDLQKTSVYVGLVGKSSAARDAAKNFINYLRSPPVRVELVRMGFMGD
jgi:molybdate transport system substrate-binding protein